jgi:DNA repair protein RecO
MDYKGICLRATNYKDKDKLLTVATFERGIITVSAKGVRSPKAKLCAGCMPLVFGEFGVTETKSGFVLTGINIEESFRNCWTDTARNLAAMLVLETTEKVCIRGEDISYELLLALKALQEINYSAAYPFTAAVWFLLEILKYVGVDYSIEDIPQGARKVLDALSAVSAEDSGTLELHTADIDTALFYLDLIAKNRLSLNLFIIKEIYAFANSGSLTP